MTGSEYIHWAKQRERFRFNIGRSSIRPCPPELLGATAEDFAINDSAPWGWPPLLHALAERYGVESSAVVLAFGTSMANHLTCAALLQPGDHVLVESPSYEPLRALPAYFGCRVGTFERRPAADFALDPDVIAAAIQPETRLVILSDYHNPTGRECGDEALQTLASLAERAGFHVLVDEVYREFSHRPGAPIAAHLSPRFISTCSLTKAYGLDGLRMGWIVADIELAERLRRLNDLFGIIMPHPSERLALRALQRIDVLRADVDALLETNRQPVERLLAERDDLSWIAPVAGPVGFVRHAPDRVDELVDLLEAEYDATVPPGRFFGPRDRFRIGFGMETAELNDGLDRLVSALDRLDQ